VFCRIVVYSAIREIAGFLIVALRIVVDLYNRLIGITLKITNVQHLSPQLQVGQLSYLQYN
jgi:hypothetical protein